MRRKNQILALGLAAVLTAASAVPAFAGYAPTGPGAEPEPEKYDAATLSKLQDNVLEYDELALRVREYNPNISEAWRKYGESKEDYQNMLTELESTYDKSMDNIDDVLKPLKQAKKLMPQLKSSVKQMESLKSGYHSLVQGIRDTVTNWDTSKVNTATIRQYEKQVVSGAQSAMIGYKQLLLNEESLESGLTLLNAVYQSTQNQAANGLATQSQVLSARQQLESTQATKLTLTANEQKLRQTLCTMLGWKYDAVPEIRDVPAADLARIDGMNPEKDKQAAQDNNFTIRYNVLDLDNKDAGSVEYQNLQRTIKQEKEEVSSSLVNLYNDVLQKRNELQTAKAAYELEKTKMETADRKWQLGTIGRLEYMQQQNALKTKEIAVKTGDLALFQAMETYDWAVKGNLKLSQ